MSRKTFISIFACLLSLLPILTHAQTLTKYEYWFDDNFIGRKSGSLSGTNKLVNTIISTNGLDNGVHKFSFRAKQSDGYYSAVTSSLFLKRTAAQSSQMEYWFDDNFDQRESISIGNTEEEQSFDLNLRDNAKFPMGFHKLNIRITLEGEGESAVYSSPVLKLSAGKATQLEYWIDDDIENACTFDGHLASDGQDYLFVSDLDLGNISPGYHRLYCRPVSNSKITAGAVTMMPVMVKAAIGRDAKLMQYTVAVDNGAAMTYSIKNKDAEAEITHSLDISQLPIGDHKLTMSFWNTYYNGVTDSATFQVSTSAFKLETPNPDTFRATDITESGFTASWGTVEDALYYDILVKPEDGDYERPVFQGGSSSTSIKVTGLDPSTSYYFQIRARNDNRSERSDWSRSIAEAVVTSAAGTSPADLAIRSISGFDGSEVLYQGYTYHYKVWVSNKSTSTWTGSFYLKDGDEDINGWNSITIPSNSAQPLEFDYTPKTIGEKELVLYYQTGGRGRGIAVETSDGTANSMKVMVSSDPTFSKGIQLAEKISAPQTLTRGEQATVTAAVKNFGENEWTGTLYLVDNGITLDYKTATLKPGKGKKLSAEWMPETTGTHEISVYYKTEKGFAWEPVAGNGFSNPASVEVLAADAMVNAEFASITHVTKDVVPKEVTEGSKVFYYFRLTDDKGNRLKGVRMFFKCVGGNMQSIETTSSGSDGIVELCLDTEGTNKIADRGETVTLTCTALLKDNNETVRFAYEPSDGEIQLTVHQGTEVSKESGFENVEKVKFTLTPGVSIKGEVGNYAKLSGGISLPVSFAAKFDDNGDFKNFTLDSKIKASGKASVGEYGKEKYNYSGDFALLPSGSVGLSGGYHYSISSDDYRAILVRMIMAWCENYTIGNNKFTDRAVKTLMEWYIKKNHLNETKNWFWGGELGLSMKALNITIPSLINRSQQIPSMRINELGLDGSFGFSFDCKTEKKDYSTSRTLQGDAYSINLNGSFDAQAKMNFIFNDRKAMWKTIQPHGLCSEQISDFYKKLNLPEHKSTHTLSIRSEEYLDGNNNYQELSHSMSLSDGWEQSVSDLEIPGITFDASWGGKSTSSFKLSSKDAWATYIGNIVNSSSKDKDLAYLLYPQLKHSYVFCSPGEIFGFWNRPPMGALQTLASKAPDPSKFKLSDAFKVEQTLSSEVSVGVKIPIAEWLHFSLDVGASLELENKPTASYYSIMDNRFMPVSIHPTTTTKQIRNWALKKVCNELIGLFDNDRNEIEPIYRMQDVYGVGSISSIGMHYEVPGLSYENTEDDNTNTDDNGDIDGGGGDGSSWARQNARYHYGLNDFNSDYARYIIGKNPRLGTKKQTDICIFTFGINNDVQNFDEGVQFDFPHYYPAGSLYGITNQGDTLFVVSEVVDIVAHKGDETLTKAQRGEFEITGHVGVDDLTPFGFSEDQPLDVYYSDADSNIWHYVGPAGTPLKVDKCGSYMMATSIKNDTENPQIVATLDDQTGIMHVNISDNIGVDLSTLQVFVNGEQKEVLMINQSNFELMLSEEEMKYMIVVNIIAKDLAGNQGYLFQIFNIDKPDYTGIDDKQVNKKAEIKLNKRKLTVDGASPKAIVTIYSIDGLVQERTKTDDNGHTEISLNRLSEGVYIVTLSDGKSKKFHIK